MKKTISFKSVALILLITALSVILTVTISAGVAFLSDGNVAHGEKYEFTQASVSGKINLKFYYSDFGSAEQMIAEVIDPITKNADNTYAYDVSDIKSVTVPATVTGGEDMECYCITVPVAPSQMTHTVRVYASSEAGAGDAIEYSVAAYCEDILASGTLSEYHNTMRALLNWGAMAQGAFDDASGVLANEGLYALNTNPINAVTEIPFNKGSVNSTENIKGKAYSLELAPDDIVFRFDVNYSGDGELAAFVSREGIDETRTNIEDLGDGIYRVSITNVGVSVFNKPYTIKVTDGEETFTATKSVLEYLSVLSTSAETQAQKDTAKAMYHLYTLAMNKTSATCQHQYAHRLSADADTSYAQCSTCFEVMGEAVSNNIDKYMPAEQLSDRRAINQTLSVSYGTDGDGTAYARLSNGATSDTNNWFAWNPIIESTDNTYASGRYLIMKIRVNENGLEQTSHQLYVSTERASLLDGTQGVTFKAFEDGQWHVAVIDLADRVGNSKGSDFKDSGNGTYAIKYLSLRPFSGCQTAEGVANATMDVAYIALCDDLSDIGSLVTETNYEWSNGSTTCIVRNSATNICVAHPSEKVEKSSTSTVYSCSLCEHVLGEEQYPETVNKYLGADYVGKRPEGGTHQITAGGRVNENGTLYHRFTGQNKTGQIFWTRMGYGGNGQPWADAQLIPFNVGTAKYVVVKMRGNNDISSVRFNVGTIVGEANYDNYDNMTVGGINLPQNIFNGKDWTYFVVDVAKSMGSWKANADGTYNVCYLQFTFNSSDAATFTSDSYFDISYIAFVDDWAEVKALTGQNTVPLINESGKYITVDAGTGTCITHSVKETASNGTYVYECSVCGEFIAEKAVSADINWYSPLSKMNDYHTARGDAGYSLSKLKYEDGVVFNRFEGTGSNHLNITGGTGAGIVADGTHETGRYLVMQYRMTSEGTLNIKITSDGKTGTAGEYSIGSQASSNLPGSWRVAVIDLSAANHYQCNSTGQIYIMLTATAEYTFDITYAAIVDDFDEVAMLVDDNGGYMYYSTSFSNAGIECETGYDPSDYRLEAVEIERAQKSNRAVNIGSVELRNDGEFDYVRTKSLADGTTPYWPSSYEYSSGSSGKYLIFKYRTNVKTGWLALYSSTQTYSAEAADLTWTDLNGDEKWHVFIVDMEKTKQNGDTFIADGEGNFSAGYIRYNLFYNAAKDANAYFDMAYVDWAATEAEAYRIADGEDIRYGYYNGNIFTTVYFNPDACSNHLGQYTSSVDGGVTSYSYSGCANCGDEAIEGINYYSSHDVMTTLNHNVTNGAVENGVTYTRFYGNGAGNDPTNTANWAKVTGGTGTGAVTSQTLNYGIYAVVKVRCTNMSVLRLVLGTAAGSRDVVDISSIAITGEWVTVVIDMSTGSKYTPGTTAPLYLSFYTAATNAANYSFDVAYVALVDSIDTAEAVIASHSDVAYINGGTSTAVSSTPTQITK